MSNAPFTTRSRPQTTGRSNLSTSRTERERNRPFIPTDHALTTRPTYPPMNLPRSNLTRQLATQQPSNDKTYQAKLLKTRNFHTTFPKSYVNYVEEEPSTMSFDATLLSDKSKQSTMAKAFILKNRKRMFMFSPSYVSKTHAKVLTDMLDSNNFIGLMDELNKKEVKLNLGSGSHGVTSCLNMSKERVMHDVDMRKDVFLATLDESKFRREERMMGLFREGNGNRVREFNRVCCFKGF